MVDRIPDSHGTSGRHDVKPRKGNQSMSRLYLAISAIRSQRFDIRVLLHDIYGFNAITEIAINHGGVAVAAGLLRGQEETLYARHHQGSLHN